MMAVLITSGCKRSLYESEYHKISHDGLNRSYLLHIPDSYKDSEPIPLVFALHGGVGSAKNIEEQSSLAEFSDEKGFILCSPNGYKRAWNAGWCCGKSAAEDVDDVGFIAKILSEIQEEYNIDPNRIYATGMSNGAMMSYRLACEMPDVFAAIAPVAGGMVAEVCDPSEPINIIHFHSYADENIPYDGGLGDGISSHYNLPLDSIREYWSRKNGCQEYIRYKHSGYEEFQHNLCSDSVAIRYYITEDGGHSWPGGTAPTKKADAPSQTLNANDMMWAFFMEHPKP